MKQTTFVLLAFIGAITILPIYAQSPDGEEWIEPTDTASSIPSVSTYLQKDSFEYGELFQYTIQITADEKDYVGKEAKIRFVNKATGTASKLSHVTLESPTTVVNGKIEGVPFDKKGEYTLHMDFGSSRFHIVSTTHFELINDADKSGTTDKPVFLSPRAQMTSGILPEDITCKKGLQLEEKIRTGLRIGAISCIKPEHREVLIKRGYIHDPSTEQDGIQLYGLKDVYSKSEPIKFEIWFRGITQESCFIPKIKILDQAQHEVWHPSRSYNCGMEDLEKPEFMNTDFKINDRRESYPVLPAGDYTLFVQFEEHKISEKITVTE